MKLKKEIANKYGILSGKDTDFDEAILKAMDEYGTRCQEDMADVIKFGKWLDENMQQREYYPMKGMSMEELFKEFKQTRLI